MEIVNIVQTAIWSIYSLVKAIVLREEPQAPDEFAVLDKFFEAICK